MSFNFIFSYLNQKPFPLYTSGFRADHTSLAKLPSFTLFKDSIMILVFFTILILMSEEKRNNFK
jgi:hypothetical protein